MKAVLIGLCAWVSIIITMPRPKNNVDRYNSYACFHVISKGNKRNIQT